MQVVPLRFGMNPTIERTILGLADVQVSQDPQQSALFITGERDGVLRALDVVSLLDQPASRAREVGLINLNYVTARYAGEQLVTLLGNEGIQAAVGGGELKSVAIVPLDNLGTLVVFAASSDMLQRVDYWVRQLDRPNEGPEERYFIYHPRYSRASDLGQSLASLLGGALPAAGNMARDTRSALAPDGQTRGISTQAGMQNQGGSAAQAGVNPVTQENVLRREARARSIASESIAVRGEGVTLWVDPRSNTLIFYTTGIRYQTLLPMIQRLDVPPKQILLETMIAEVTLTGEFAYGVEFAFTSGGFSGGTLGGLNLPGGGLSLNWVNSLTQQVRAKLSASNTLVNVLSNPTLVVRDGVKASIIVGNDVPTVGATASDPSSRKLRSRRCYPQDGPRSQDPSHHQRRRRGGDGDQPEHFEHGSGGVGRAGRAGVFRACRDDRGRRALWRKHPARGPHFRAEEQHFDPCSRARGHPGAWIPVPLGHQEQGAHGTRRDHHAARDRGPEGMERNPDRNARGAEEPPIARADQRCDRSWRRNNACCAACSRRHAARQRERGAGAPMMLPGA